MIAMALPMTIEPTTRPLTFPAPRINSPTDNATINTNIVRSVPILRASQGATGANNPRQSTGSVVIALATAGVRPRSLDISASTAPRLGYAVRRLKATKMMLQAK